MIVNKDNFYEVINKLFISFPEKITKVTQEEFEKVFKCEMAKNSKNIVYIWKTQKPISRVDGCSEILYIGQTKQSFKDRYLKYANLEATSEANSLKYKTIIEKYGAIEIMVCDFSMFGETLLEAEGQLLWWYFQNHCEYPPMNYTKTKIRRDEYLINKDILFT